MLRAVAAILRVQQVHSTKPSRQRVHLTAVSCILDLRRVLSVSTSEGYHNVCAEI